MSSTPYFPHHLAPWPLVLVMKMREKSLPSQKTQPHSRRGPRELSIKLEVSPPAQATDVTIDEMTRQDARKVSFISPHLALANLNPLGGGTMDRNLYRKICRICRRRQRRQRAA